MLLLVQALRRISPDLVFTCISPDQVHLVYLSISLKLNLYEFLQVTFQIAFQIRSKAITTTQLTSDIEVGMSHTGTDNLVSINILWVKPFYFKKLKDLVLDISMDEDSRIYGSSWFEWLSNCKLLLDHLQALMF